jgi:hypothetical protein
MLTPHREKCVADTDPIGKTYEVYGWYHHQEWVQVKSVEQIGAAGEPLKGLKMVSVVPVNPGKALRDYTDMFIGAPIDSCPSVRQLIRARFKY